MGDRLSWRVVLLLVTVSAAGLPGCGGSALPALPNAEPQAGPSPVPPLEAIDYAPLGAGRLGFTRHAPSRGTVSHYILDADRKRSWGFRVESSGFSTAALSPDGTRIAVATSAPDLADRSCDHWDTTIYIVNVDGTVAPGGWGVEHSAGVLLSWSLDGQLYCAHGDECNDHTSFQRLEPRGKNVTTICDFQAGAFERGLVSFSDSSNADLVYTDGHTVWVASPGCAAPPRVVDASVSVNVTAVAWAPDGSWFAYLSNQRRENGVHVEAMMVRADGRRAESLFTVPSTVVRTNALDLAWSRDGSRMAFNYGEQSGEVHVFVLDRRDGSIARITSAGGVVDRNVSWAN